MHKMLTVAQREYSAAVKTKSFLISLFLMPLLMGGGAIAQLFLQDQVDLQEKRFAVVDRTEGEQLVAALESAVRTRNSEGIYDAATGEQTKPVFEIEQVASAGSSPDAIQQQRFELSERVRRGEIFGFLEIGAHVYEHGSRSADLHRARNAK